MFYTLAYITGGLIVALSLFIFMFKSRKATLILKLMVDITGAINLTFVLLATGNQQVIAGLVTMSIAVIRNTIYYFRDKNKFFDHYAWAIGFASLFALSLIFTYKSPLSILPVVGSTVSALTLFCRTPKIVKAGAIFCQGMCIIYYGILIPGSDILTIFSFLSSITGFTGALVGIIHIFMLERKEKNKNNNC